MNAKALIGVFVVVLIAGLGIWYVNQPNSTNSEDVSGAVGNMDNMAGMDTTGTSTATSTTGTTTGTSTTATTTGAVKEFTVNGKNFSFTPTTLSVNKGDHVKITFKNSGGFHDFRIDEFNVATDKINGGANAVVEFDATKAGSFEYYCSVGNHRAMGMKGTLTVK